jgi:hypothetical protein
MLCIGSDLLFDANGLNALFTTLQQYSGNAARLSFRLKLEQQAYQDYYSLGEPLGDDACVPLPVTAERLNSRSNAHDTIIVSVPHCEAFLDYPTALAPAVSAQTPLALLAPYHSDFDILFANQIALFSDLARRVPRSPRALLRAALRRRGGEFRKRAVMAYADVHPAADVHHTAVVEGSVVQAGARIGAHCVVRCSHIGRNAQLHDGAKVEYSVVGSGSWLMHDLVLIRSHVEDEVFLIHGPYQFSSFQHGSAAFATIMMDYRPDGRPICVTTASQRRAYGGRFLGALLEEGAKSLGSSLLAPGIVVPRDTWLACNVDEIHRTPRGTLPKREPLSPAKIVATTKRLMNSSDMDHHSRSRMSASAPAPTTQTEDTW